MISKYIFDSIRFAHKILFNKDLPKKVGIYFHNIRNDEVKYFVQMLDYFLEKEYVFCGPNEYLTSNKKCVFLSFDDNHKEWLEIGKLLYDRGLVGTFFCNSGVIRDITDDDKIKDYYKRIDYKGIGIPLSTDEIILLNKQYTQIIGSHSINHYNLAALSVYDAKNEIINDKLRLQDILGIEVDHFSYPFGMKRFFNSELRSYCLDIGFTTISNAIPGLLHGKISKSDISRTLWDLKNPLNHNIENLSIDGRIFTALTGKSSISYH
jgi:hypothetical protein